MGRLRTLHRDRNLASVILDRIGNKRLPRNGCVTGLSGHRIWIIVRTLCVSRDKKLMLRLNGHTVRIVLRRR